MNEISIPKRWQFKDFLGIVEVTAAMTTAIVNAVNLKTGSIMNGKTFKSALESATDKEIGALIDVLDISEKPAKHGLINQSYIEKVWRELSYNGSNDIAYILRGKEGVDYPEIVRDVCQKMKVDSINQEDTESAVANNEEKLLQKVFSGMWDNMTQQERDILLESMQIADSKDIRLGGGAVTSSLIVAKLGGFGTYQIAMVVANTIARALTGKGLTLAVNAGIARGLGVVIGPIGWIASGLWLLNDLCSPAFRKTVPAVVQIAALRQVTTNRRYFGVMGHGSVGKDSLLKNVFGIDTGEIHPIPGTTEKVLLYDANISQVKYPTRVINFPGFGDLRQEVDTEIREHSQHCGAILYLLNGSEIPQIHEIEEFKKYSSVIGKHGPVPVIPILNKWDKADKDEQDDIYRETCKRLKRKDVICASMKEKKGNDLYHSSRNEIRKRINELLIELTKRKDSVLFTV